MKILLVEDNKLSGELSKAILERFGECDLVQSSLEGFKIYTDSIFTENKYDLVCLDVIMPVYSGYQVLTQIRNFEKYNKCPKTKVVMVSALKSNEFKQDFYKAGADGFLNKPINPEIVKRTLKEIGLL